MGKAGTITAMIVAAVLGAGLAVALVLSQPRPDGPDAQQPIPLTDPDPWSHVSVPDFELINQDGQTVTRDDIIGDGRHYVVMDFFFSNCVLVCPLMNGNMLLASDRLEGEPVRFVSFSVDPRNDTPESLQQHADALGADTSRWTFLTGEPGEVAQIVSALGFAELTEDPDDANIIQLQDGSTMRNIVHPSRFLVLDPEGRIVGSYLGTNSDQAKQMVVHLKRVASVWPNI